MTCYLEQVLSAVVLTIPSALTCPHGFGVRKLEDRSISLPRVVWARDDQTPSRLVAPTPSPNDPQRRIADELVPIVVHILAPDEETADTIIDVEVRAIYSIFGPKCFSTAGSDESNDTLKSWGYYRQLKVTIPRPVYRDTPPTAKIKSFQLYDGITQDEAGWISVPIPTP